MSLIERIAHITSLDTDSMVRARTRQGQLTKPVGSLGMLEDIAVQIAGITQHLLPWSVERKAVITMAGDHGITSEGVSAYPAAVTLQMVYNFLRRRAAFMHLQDTSARASSW